MKNYIINYEEYCASFKNLFDRTKDNFNSVREWTKTELIQADERTPIGSAQTKKVIQSVVGQTFLAPVYNEYCKVRGLKPVPHTKFADMLIKFGEDYGWQLRKGKFNYGTWIEGLKVDTKITRIDI